MVAPYDPNSFPRFAKSLCRFGALRADLAEAFGVDEVQIERWQKEHAEFAEACADGRTAACESLSSIILKDLTNSTREKIVNIGGTPARISINERPRITLAAAKWLAARYEKDQLQASPLEQLARQLMGTAIRPKEEK